MATIIQAGIPSDEFALAETFRTCPDVVFECERIVESPQNSVMPLITVWTRDTPRQQLETALADDPSVAEYTLLASYEDEWLYRMEWTERIQLALDMLTTAAVIFRNIYGTADGWSLEILFPTRNELARTHKFCAEHELSFDVLSIRAFDGDQFDSRSTLTNEQYEALLHAFKPAISRCLATLPPRYSPRSSTFLTKHSPSTSATRTMLSSIMPSVDDQSVIHRESSDRSTDTNSIR